MCGGDGKYSGVHRDGPPRCVMALLAVRRMESGVLLLRAEAADHLSQ